MPTQDTCLERTHAPGEPPTHSNVGSERSTDQRGPIRSAQGKLAEVASARKRRVLARWLRRTANCAHDPDPLTRRRDALLHYRATAVRTELLEIAAILEHAHNPDPKCVAALRDLLANGCDSPLYNADIHASELRATLHYVRSGLLADAQRDQPGRQRSSRGN
jgi:hypothetical protein